MMEDNIIFIKGNVASSKNGKRWTGKILMNSKATNRYFKESELDWIDKRHEFMSLVENLEKPFKIGFHFVRKSKHKYDFINPVQTVQDIMVRFNWIEDDNIDEMMPFPFTINNQWSTHDKNNPGVFIKIIVNG